jgi:hypothetical protein
MALQPSRSDQVTAEARLRALRYRLMVLPATLLELEGAGEDTSLERISAAIPGCFIIPFGTDDKAYAGNCVWDVNSRLHVHVPR